jgi:hypothetical protein
MVRQSPDALRVAGFAILAGAILGTAAATIESRLRPWRVGQFSVAAAGADAPRAEAAETYHNFGSMGVGESGAHEFVVRNTGGTPLTLRRGTTSCSCTVSDFEASEGGTPEGRKVVLPGGSTVLKVQWKAKPPGGPFRQQATITTDDPRRPELVFFVEGLAVPNWKAVPPSVMVRASASTGDSKTIDVFTFGKAPPEVKSVSIDHPQATQFFSLSTAPLPEADLAAEPSATGGFRLAVEVKPGLPLGPLRQLISIAFDMPEPTTAEIFLEGSVGGDLVLLGPGWDSSRQMLVLGTVSGKTGHRSQLFLTARGTHRDSVKPVVREVVPDSLQVTIGAAGDIGAGAVVRLPIEIVIPPGSRPANHLCSQQGPAGRIVLETGHPDTPVLTIPVCVAIGP